MGLMLKNLNFCGCHGNIYPKLQEYIGVTNPIRGRVSIFGPWTIYSMWQSNSDVPWIAMASFLIEGWKMFQFWVFSVENVRIVTYFEDWNVVWHLLYGKNRFCLLFLDLEHFFSNAGTCTSWTCTRDTNFRARHRLIRLKVYWRT